MTEHKSSKSVSVPFDFDEAMRKLMRVKRPVDGNYRLKPDKKKHKNFKR